jgi:hypothetical protein
MPRDLPPLTRRGGQPPVTALSADKLATIRHLV